MKNLIQFSCDLYNLNSFAKKLANISIPSDIFLLQGELGSGKTTFTRFFISELYRKMKITLSTSIKSPTFPIMINYDLVKYEIFHYDFFRLKNNIELKELGIFENFLNNISIIEWPEILLKTNSVQNYYLIKFKLEKINIRGIEISHSNKSFYLNIND